MLHEALTEADMQHLVEEVAVLHGWRVFHDVDSRRNRAGFPDLVLVKRPHLLFVELKTKHGRVTAEQRGWMRELAGVDLLTVALVRPDDLDDLITRLTAP